MKHLKINHSTLGKHQHCFCPCWDTSFEKDVNAHHREDGNDKNSKRSPGSGYSERQFTQGLEEKFMK